jgi:hypothetical protein
VSIWRTGAGTAVFHTTNDQGEIVVSEGTATFE